MAADLPLHPSRRQLQDYGYFVHHHYRYGAGGGATFGQYICGNRYGAGSPCRMDKHQVEQRQPQDHHKPQYDEYDRNSARTTMGIAAISPIVVGPTMRSPLSPMATNSRKSEILLESSRRSGSLKISAFRCKTIFYNKVC